MLQAVADAERAHGAAAVDEYVAAIWACGGATLTSWVQAVGTLQRMHDLGVEVPLSAYTAAVAACALGGDASRRGQRDVRCYIVPWEWALALFKEADDRGLPLDEEIFLSAISACGSSMQWQWTIHLLEQAKLRGVSPTQDMYKRTILACSRNQKWRH